MENKQLHENSQQQWISTWSSFITQAPFHAGEKHENATNIIVQVLEALQQGNSCIEATEDQVKVLNNLVGFEQQEHLPVAPFIFDGSSLYLYRYWNLETRLAKQIERLWQQQIPPVDLTAYSGLLQDKYQKSALTMVAGKILSIITGGPGTGKTYTLARIIAVLNQAIPDIRIAMAAPTGKAAQRMQEALRYSFQDPKLLESGLITQSLQMQTTQTIHRLLGLGQNQQPRFHSRQPLPYDVIVIDEASMLDLELATLLFEAIPDHCRLILLGDAQQLASVEVGSVLADLQQIPALAEHRVHLVNSRRFTEDALIGKMAKFIQQFQAGKPHTEILDYFQQQIVPANQLSAITLSHDMQDQVQLEFLPASAQSLNWTEFYEKLMQGYLPYLKALKNYLQAEETSEDTVKPLVQAFDHYRLLAATRHGALGLEKLNQYAKQWLNQALKTIAVGDWYIGRPVMMTYNDYQLGLSNGDIGICVRHREHPDQFEVYFPSLNKWVAATRLPKNIETAFALTIHKSQGSEFTHTTVVLDQTAKNLLSQELIYTAITRAKKVVSLLVDPEAFVQSLTVKTTRKSGLVSKINRKLSL